MSKQRFRLLEIEMIRRGVALRHARRAAVELECHHRELLEQALGRGEPPGQAQRSADEALGADAVIVDRYANQKELQSRAYRWRAAYVLAPLLGFAAVFVAAILALIVLSGHSSAALPHTGLPAALTRDVNTALTLLLLWLVPAAVAMGFGALAGRQRIAFRWLLGGVVVLSTVTALMNVQFVPMGGSPHGLITAGIGFSTGKMPDEILRALGMAALALVPAGWLRYRVMSRQVALE